ncbi:MAG: MFS transporter [Pseudomonadota bacterium]
MMKDRVNDVVLQSSRDEIRARIDAGPISPMIIMIIGIGFLLNLVDGFDVVAMSVAGPSISSDWGISDSEKGWILSSALVGMSIGAAFLAPLADVFGRRPLVIAATALIGVSMILTGFIPQSVLLLMAVRVLAGLGIGIIFANGAAIASEFSPDKYRNLAVTMVVMGYPFGAMVVGPIADFIIPIFGWEMLFVYGGIATLLLGVMIHLTLPESVMFLATRGRDPDRDLADINSTLRKLGREPLDELVRPSQDDAVSSANVSSLLKAEHRTSTVVLWSVYFLGFLTLYFQLSWIPSLFVDSGFTRSQGIFALTLNNMGAVIGIVAIGLITTHTKLARPISVFFAGSAVLMVVLYQFKTDSLLALNASIFAIGLLLQGAFTAMYALAARVYPAEIRATGIGWAAGLGRTGAILSPIAAGYLASANWDLYGLFLLFSFPLFAAALLVLRFRH